jgi:hypothetical protein
MGRKKEGGNRKVGVGFLHCSGSAIMELRVFERARVGMGVIDIDFDCLLDYTFFLFSLRL